MIIGIGTKKPEVRTLLEEMVRELHRSDEVRACAIDSTAGDQPLGRDVIEQSARHAARQTLVFMHDAKLAFGVEGGLDMTPSGIFLVCAAVGRTRDGREATGWSRPRLLPPSVAHDVTEGGKLQHLLQQYREKWHPSDIFSAADLDELINRQHSVREALGSVFEVLRISPLK